MKLSTNINELEYLYGRSKIIINFMLHKNHDDTMMLQVNKIIEETYKKRNLKGMKTLSRDLNAWAKGFTVEDTGELEKLLEDKFDETLSGDKTTHKVISNVLIKKQIDNDNEYRVIHEYLLDISEGDSFFENVIDMKKLLISYNKRLM